jgi:hypothetical protein
MPDNPAALKARFQTLKQKHDTAMKDWMKKLGTDPDTFSENVRKFKGLWKSIEGYQKMMRDIVKELE